MKIFSSLKIAFPVSSVWFGALVGPSMISGAFSIVYFIPYGVRGLFLPLVSMGVASVIIGMGAEIARRNHAYNYHSYTQCLYGTKPIGKTLSVIMEVYMLVAMVVGGSSVMALGGIFFHDLIGVSALCGSVLIACLSILLALGGEKPVRVFSSLVSIVLVFGMLFLTIICISFQPEGLKTVLFQQSASSGLSLWTGVRGAVLLGLSNACNVLTLCAVEQKITKKKHSVAVGLCSFVMNSLAFIIEVLMILPYCSDSAVLSQSVPVQYIVETKLSAQIPWLTTLYMITMFFGLVSSGAPQFHAVAARMKPYYPNWKFFKRKKLCNIFTGIIYFAVCIAISQLGLRTIISNGYSMLGYLAIPLLIIPICVVIPLRNRKANS